MQTSSPLLQALYSGDKATALALADQNAETITLFEAAALGRTRDVAVLLHLRRERALEVGDDGFTALHLAAFFGHYYCAKLLLEERANPNAVSQNAMQVTPLHSAVANHNEETAAPIVAALLTAGADPNARQTGGSTPLQAALQNGHARIERLLRAKGARATES